MDATRIHLFITHLPVFGLFLGFLAMAYGFIRDDKHVKIVSFVIVMISVVGGMIAFQTGESAEETVENIAGILENTIEEHEESAELSIYFLYGVGILALFAIYAEWMDKRYSRQILIMLLVLTLVTFSLAAWTASLGGKIRHPEIDNPNTDHPETHSGEDHGGIFHSCLAEVHIVSKYSGVA